MRFLHPDGQVVHSAYCTNVHGGEELDEILGQLDRFAVPVRQELETTVLGVGLWLSARVARLLAEDPREVDRLRRELDRRDLEVMTLNGFPYEGFQQPVVKHRVYHPDWTEPARLDYTKDLAVVLAGLLPDDVATGSISTLPFAWHHPWSTDRQALAAEQFEQLAHHLEQVGERTGRRIRVGLEPEPGCVVETTAEAVDRMQDLDRSAFGVCLDLCHLAVQFEEPAAALNRLAAGGLDVVKAQVSAALHVTDPSDPAAREALEAFVEPRFLHQVRAGHAPAVGRDDLPEALGGALPLAAGPDEPWRVHFHVPLGRSTQPPLEATTGLLRQSLEELVGGTSPLTTHLEVETYTWTVVPEADRPTDDAGLAHGIAGELSWLRDVLTDLGLKEM